ncbi:hypothetical protein LY76DRAFT_645452 [Colletotrichum caudatum]|nr:hypothetical protein LY76DRAFT_645452 [Colletotrichum caudatum]
MPSQYSDDRFASDCDANGCRSNPYLVGVAGWLLLQGQDGRHLQGVHVSTKSRVQSAGGSVSPDVQNGITEPLFTNTARVGVVVQFPNTKLQEYLVRNGAKFNSPEFLNIFDDRSPFSEVGGRSKLNSAFDGKWVLVMSLWNDHHIWRLGQCRFQAMVTYSNTRFGTYWSDGKISA